MSSSETCQPTAASLFSGCGGSDLGLTRAGAKVIWANDIWKPATQTYRLNFPEVEVVCEDVSNISEFPKVDILSGCYPCQGFSQAGKRDPNARINYLYREFSRALGVVRPKAFIVENVIGMRFGANFELLKKQIRSFRCRGYVVNWKLLDARDYGLAQERKRIFIVGFRSDLSFRNTFPSPTHGDLGCSPWVPQRDVLKDFSDWPNGEFDDQPLSWYYMSRRRRRDWDEPAPCVVANSRHVALHPLSPEMEYVGPDKYRFKEDTRPRRYTYRECAALQGFPPTFSWGDFSLSVKYRLIGNAVPPPLFEAVSAPVVDALKALKEAQPTLLA